ncbi:amidohydrolase family protein [Kutzneria viridogrisea]|uniref:Imidazolonepropionase-like amidohydrolase n=1 Tax=Kutzneria viridogrisea TaxID=47990 RepID=A0ABR6BJX7_9PSEU|nr:imidazolonepropionase-like amidohydrolase [Kutzneria viridogrisea]
MERIDADLLIPGRGEPVAEGCVLFEGGRIHYAGPAAQAPEAPVTTTSRAAAVLPGLWDCHSHLMGLPPSSGMNLQVLTTEPLATRGARCARDLRAALDAGITSVREVGGIGVHVARAVEEGTIEGPTVYAAGAVLSTTGGHGDVHAVPLEWMHDLSMTGADFRLCDGVDECMKATREQLRRNARVIKVCASGGVLSEVDHPMHQQFTVAEMRAVVEVAGMAERVVAAHCHGKAGIMAALEAGVRTIEHGSYLDEEACDAMLETGAVLVATRLIIEDLLAASHTMPPYAATKLAALADQHAQAVALAHSKGVTFATGTDVVASSPAAPSAWGSNARELSLLVSLGFTPLQAIEAATANGPLTVGPQAPRTGQLRADHEADLITLDADPIADISVLTDPDHVVGVWKSGRRVKG